MITNSMMRNFNSLSNIERMALECQERSKIVREVSFQRRDFGNSKFSVFTIVLPIDEGQSFYFRRRHDSKRL